MAIELSQGRIDQLHSNLVNRPEVPLRFIALTELSPYYAMSDYVNYIYKKDALDETSESEQTLALLILAAEEELEGYPMTLGEEA